MLADPFDDKLKSVQARRMPPPQRRRSVDTLPAPLEKFRDRLRIRNQPGGARSGRVIAAIRAQLPAAILSRCNQQPELGSAPSQPDLLPGSDSRIRRRLRTRNPAAIVQGRLRPIEALDARQGEHQHHGDRQTRGTSIPYECTLTTINSTPRCWQMTTYTWKASCPVPQAAVLRRRCSWNATAIRTDRICEDLVIVCPLLRRRGACCRTRWAWKRPANAFTIWAYYRPGDCAPYILRSVPDQPAAAACTGAMGYGAAWPRCSRNRSAALRALPNTTV